MIPPLPGTLKTAFLAVLALGATHAAIPAFALPPPFMNGLEGPPTSVPVYPTRLDENTRYFRGMDERQAPLARVLAMLAGLSGEVIPSHRLSTLKRLHPERPQQELLALLDADLAEWRRTGAWFSLADCHSDPADCSAPSFRVLQGTAFPDTSFVPVELQSRIPYWPHSHEPWKLLRPLDPVISTSIDVGVARSFTQRLEQESAAAPAGYLLVLRDSSSRHCPAEYRAPSEICIIENTEYADESEMPFWNYILPGEIEAVERGLIRARRGSTPGTLRLFQVERPVQGKEIERMLPPSCFPSRPPAVAAREAERCPTRIDSRLLDALLASGASTDR